MITHLSSLWCETRSVSSCDVGGVALVIESASTRSGSSEAVETCVPPVDHVAAANPHFPSFHFVAKVCHQYATPPLNPETPTPAALCGSLVAAPNVEGQYGQQSFSDARTTSRHAAPATPRAQGCFIFASALTLPVLDTSL
jgi:hypothetical protein